MKNLTLLIVEDEKETRELMVSALQGVFGEVMTAQNGEEGLKKFKKFHPNIVLTDISMPIVDGLDMAKSVKAISPATPIIAISAFSEKEKLFRAIDSGISKYVLKPIDMDELLEVIATIAREKITTASDIDLGGGFVFNQTKHTLLRGSEEVALTKKELAFISLLASQLGSIVSLAEIKKHVWLSEKVNDAAIRTFVKRVRDKTGADMIKNISGVGYKMEKL